MAGPYYSESSPSHPRPAAASVYPGMLPPPVPYPGGNRWRVVAVILLVVVIVASTTTAVIYALTTESHASAGGTITEASAKAAIQGYLNAMERNDTEAVARNTLCGLYDGVKDKRSDQALARLSAEQFRKQFSEVDVTSVDKLVFLAENQAQVLFSMQVVPTSRGAKKREEQAVATLIAADGHILVCQYVLKSGSQY